MNLNILRGFRHEVYGCFPRAADALFNTVDALLTETQARSFPELSLSPLFERRWCSLYEAFEDGRINQNRLRGVFARVSAATGRGRTGVAGHRCHQYRASAVEDLARPDRGLQAEPARVVPSDQLWLAILDGGGVARAAQQLDLGAGSATHPFGPNQRGGGGSPIASARSLAWLPSYRGQRSLVQLCAVSAGDRGIAVRQVASSQTQAGVVLRGSC